MAMDELIEPYPLPDNPVETAKTYLELRAFRARGGYPEMHPEPCNMTGNYAMQILVLRSRFRAFSDAHRERDRQDQKWGPQDHDNFTYLSILGEEVGEAHQAALHDKFGGDHSGTLRLELVHVAAVALAMIEKLDREHYETR